MGVLVGAELSSAIALSYSQPVHMRDMAFGPVTFHVTHMSAKLLSELRPLFLVQAAGAHMLQRTVPHGGHLSAGNRGTGTEGPVSAACLLYTSPSPRD